MTYTTLAYFMGYNLTTLRSEVLRALRVTDTTRYSPDQGSATYTWIDRALNRGQREFVTKTLCLKSQAILELKSGYSAYRLPGDFIDLEAAYLYDAALQNGYRELTIKTIEELNDEYSDYRTTSGDPTLCYLDRKHGSSWFLGLYPIPNADGGTITYDATYGGIYYYLCPIYEHGSDYQTVMYSNGTVGYMLMNDDYGIHPKIDAMDGNVLLEYYRLPIELTTNDATMYPELQKEFHEALIWFAAGDLLLDNPEDSVEYKRGIMLVQRFNQEILDYNKKRQKFRGKDLRAKSHAWGWLANMDWHRDLP